MILMETKVKIVCVFATFCVWASIFTNNLLLQSTQQGFKNVQEKSKKSPVEQIIIATKAGTLLQILFDEHEPPHHTPHHTPHSFTPPYQCEIGEICEKKWKKWNNMTKKAIFLMWRINYWSYTNKPMVSIKMQNVKN